MLSKILLKSEIYVQDKYFIYCSRYFPPDNKPAKKDFLDSIIIDGPFCALCNSPLDEKLLHEQNELNPDVWIVHCLNDNCSYDPYWIYGSSPPEHCMATIKEITLNMIDKYFDHFWLLYCAEYNRLPKGDPTK